MQQTYIFFMYICVFSFIYLYNLVVIFTNYTYNVMSKWGVLSGKCVMITYFLKYNRDIYMLSLYTAYLILSLVCYNKIFI